MTTHTDKAALVRAIYAAADVLRIAYRALPVGHTDWERCVTVRAEAVSAAMRDADSGTLADQLHVMQQQLRKLGVAS